MLPRILFLAVVTFLSLPAQDLPPGLPALPYAETLDDWRPLDIPRDRYLDDVEGLVRFAVRSQAPNGAVIDPILQREHQYSTPYFAYALGVLLHAGRARDLAEAGVRAMEHSTASFAEGADGIPDRHGEFFIAPLTGALELYRREVPAEQYERWRERMKTPIEKVIEGRNVHRNNWRTYAMKGEWMRAEAGLVPREKAVEFIEHAWISVSQRSRIAYDKWGLYQDWSSDPNPHGVEAVGRGNLIAMLAHGYDGPSAEEMQQLVDRGTRTALLFQSPDGQCPPNGRTDAHVWNDVLYGLTFEVMAERNWALGDRNLAGQFRRAAMLALRSAERWKRGPEAGEWAGFWSITKNFFDPRWRVGHQPASQVGNYSGAVMYHLAEAWEVRRTDIPEKPAPAEIGGYALAADVAFGSAVANAGGLQLFANTRGDRYPRYDLHWSALGVVRIAKKDWDSRLGPSDGVYDLDSGLGVSFAPAWKENGRWLRMAEQHQRYEASFTPIEAAREKVVCRIDYFPRQGRQGPTFRHEFTITPERIRARLTADGVEEFGVTWPILIDDGRKLAVGAVNEAVVVSYPDGGDEQRYIAGEGADRIIFEDVVVRSTYGDLKPVRVEAMRGEQITIIEPRRGASR